MSCLAVILFVTVPGLEWRVGVGYYCAESPKPHFMQHLVLLAFLLMFVVTSGMITHQYIECLHST